MNSCNNPATGTAIEELERALRLTARTVMVGALEPGAGVSITGPCAAIVTSSLKVSSIAVVANGTLVSDRGQIGGRSGSDRCRMDVR